MLTLVMKSRCFADDIRINGDDDDDDDDDDDTAGRSRLIFLGHKKMRAVTY